MNRKLTIAAAAAVGVLMSASVASAVDVTDTFTVSATVAADCVIQAPGSMAFGTVGALESAVDTTGTITVGCTNSTPYNVKLDEGGTGATVSDRKMTGPSAATLNYSLFTDSGRATNWDNTIGVAGTGNGADQDITVYGRIPSQTAPGVGAYTDVVTLTVTF